MRRILPWLVLAALFGPPPAARGDSAAPLPSKDKRERLLEIYRNEAEGYTIYRDASRREKVELRGEPVYLWTNPVRSGGQDGAVFVWTCRGRAEVVGTFFSDPATGPRKLNHELHSLSTSILDVTRVGAKTWTPEAPGIELLPIADAPPPSATAKARMVQMRALIRDFAANTIDKADKRWELRPLPHPLYRYESTDPDIVDGAVFAFVTSAGTDPEALVVLEARRPVGGGSPIWHSAAGRFTDLDLWIRYKGTQVLAASRVEWDGPRQDAKHRYRAFHDRDIPAVEDETPNAKK
jgi:hypothetical protein